MLAYNGIAKPTGFLLAVPLIRATAEELDLRGARCFRMTTTIGDLGYRTVAWNRTSRLGRETSGWKPRFFTRRLIAGRPGEGHKTLRKLCACERARSRPAALVQTSSLATSWTHERFPEHETKQYIKLGSQGARLRHTD